MREELIFLLNESAELEHSLSCSYLFAAFTLRDRPDEGLPEAQRVAVQAWKQQLISVAVEEMYHLAAVTNLLTAVGAPPHFDRPNFPHDCAYYLPDYQIELRPLSEMTLDHFIAIEQPDGSNIPAIVDPSHVQRVLGDMDNEIGPDPHRFDSQGDVYTAVLSCLEALVERLGEENVFVGEPVNGAVRNFLKSGGWEPITSLASAEAAVAHIVSQGEGAAADSADSHYARFQAIKNQYLAMKLEDPSFSPTWPVVANPFVRTPPEGSGPVNLITDEFAIQVSDLFNEAYGAMLHLLGRFFISFDETDKEAMALSRTSVQVMGQVITPLGELLCRLPAGPTHEEMTAGPSFVLRTVHALADKDAAWRMLEERFVELADYATLLATQGGPAEALTPVATALGRIARTLTTVREPFVRQRGGEAPATEAQPAAVTNGRIEVEHNGPYVLHGDVPLLEMAPVHTFNGEPVEWHTLREIPVVTRPVRLCRCGQSSTKPFCDSTHLRIDFDGTEAPERPFFERAAVGKNGDITVADDRPLCTQAGFCGTRTTTVWKLLPDSADPEKAKEMAEMIFRCPSGRLVLLKQGEVVEPELPQGVAITPGGPIWVRGGIPIEDSSGQAREERNRVTLCRCGQSWNKPYCDGTHVKLHFDER